MENYIKIEPIFIFEPIDFLLVEKFFVSNANNVLFVKNRYEKVIGIISLTEYKKWLEDGEVHINYNFKKILYETGYVEEVSRFFAETKYTCIPVMTSDGELIECYRRNNYLMTDKWINIANPHLANILKEKKITHINVCIVDELSKKIYDYIKSYATYFDQVEYTRWQDIELDKAEEVLVVAEKSLVTNNVKAKVYSLSSLVVELEYRLLLSKCKSLGLELYLVTIPTNKNVWNVTEEEKERMASGQHWANFLRNKEQYHSLIKEVSYVEDNIDEFIEACLDLPLVMRKGDICYQCEHIGRYANVVNGNRVTTDTPIQYQNCIYLSGNSFVFGPLVDDYHTCASFLQRKLKQRNGNYAVINEGMRGVSLYESIKRLNADNFKEGDKIVLFLNLDEVRFLLDDPILDNFFCGVKIHHLEDIFNSFDRIKIKTYFIESPVHPNRVGYEATAECLIKMFDENYNDLWKRNVSEEVSLYKQNDFVENHRTELDMYLSQLKEHIHIGSNGAIVMNCNPLTYGHKHLIDYASKHCEHLYLFVVQEDKSVFSYEDRFEMVKACAEEYSNVYVLPSGQFIISAYTFPEYFTKQMAQANTIVDTSNDVEIFGQYIAPALNIKKRFAGEEPLDIVTAQYNQTMKRILPQYGIEFIEISRLEKKALGTISATKVREAMADGEWDCVKKLVPLTTYRILEKKYKKNVPV